MTDERLLARLRGRGNKDTIAAADRIEALTAELAQAVEGQKIKALEQILEERGAVFDAMVDAAEDAAGKDVSFNVVVGRALRAAIAEIKGESHE
jgi:hypothetical protein